MKGPAKTPRQRPITETRKMLIRKDQNRLSRYDH